MDNKVKEALCSASYLTYHWRQYSFEQLEREMIIVCGLCDKALGRFKDDSITGFERGQWSVIQNVISFVQNYQIAAELCREAGFGYKKIAELQKDCGNNLKEDVNNFIKESKISGTSLKLEEQRMKKEEKCCGNCIWIGCEDILGNGWCYKKDCETSCDKVCEKHEF